MEVGDRRGTRTCGVISICWEGVVLISEGHPRLRQLVRCRSDEVDSGWFDKESCLQSVDSVGKLITCEPKVYLHLAEWLCMVQE